MARVTIEDSLLVAKTRFGLVSLASKRAHQLLKGSAPLMESKNREIVLALRENAAVRSLCQSRILERNKGRF